jgi:hypothetical protein
LSKEKKRTLNYADKEKIGFSGRTVNPIVDEATVKYNRGCLHRCPYCHFQKFAKSYLERNAVGFYPEKLDVSVKNASIFVETIGDIFGSWIPSEWISEILKKCRALDKSNTFVFITKHPFRYKDFLKEFPKKTILGTTIETDDYPIGFNDNVSSTSKRLDCVIELNYPYKMIIIEPIMRFKPIFKKRLIKAKPKWVIIGSNSIGNIHLPEPSREQIVALIDTLKGADIEVLLKHNLERFDIKPNIYQLHIKFQRSLDLFMR